MSASIDTRCLIYNPHALHVDSFPRTLRCFPTRHSMLDNGSFFSNNSGGDSFSGLAASGSSRMLIAFRLCVVTIGIMGCTLNVMVLIALSDRKLPKTTTIILMMNQVSLDLASCVLVVVSYAFRLVLNDQPLTGSWGFFICFLFTSDDLVYIGLTASTASIVIIALERYAKIVHSVAYRNRFKRWVQYNTIVWLKLLFHVFAMQPIC